MSETVGAFICGLAIGGWVATEIWMPVARKWLRLYRSALKEE